MSPGPSARDIVVYGGVSWDQPWLTEHQLAHAFQRAGHRVLYVNPPRSVLTSVRYGVTTEALRATAAVFSRRVVEVDGIHVVSPLALPPLTHPVARRMSLPWARRQVEVAIRKLGFRPQIVVGARGITEGVPRLGTPFVVALVKDWLQAGSHLTGADAGGLRRRELAAWGGADLVCAISRRLVERLAEDGIEAELLRHGANAEMAQAFATATPSPSLAALPQPVLGCIGRIDGRWAYDALASLADAYPEGSVVLAGPVSPRLTSSALEALKQRPNVHSFAAIPGSEVPRWLAAFDCSLVPYLADEWQRYASPIKVWDYLLAGNPIAATGSPALGEFPPGLIEFEDDPRALPRLVERALRHGTSEARASRRRYAADNTWDRRAEQLLAMIDEREAAGE